MKEGIHPQYVEATVTCGCGNKFVTRSTKKNIAVEIWRRLDARIRSPRARLANVRVYETHDLFVDYGGER